MHTERFHGLDTVRAFALVSGIFLHATMTFMPSLASFGFPADVSQSQVLQTLFYVIHLFRMTLFFVIAGFFSHLAFHRKGMAVFLLDRSKRILVPFIIGWIFFGPLIIGVIFFHLAPPLSDAAQNAQSAPIPNGFPFAHLWFLYYLCLFYISVLSLRAVFNKFDVDNKIKLMIDAFLTVVVKSCGAPFILAIPVSVSLYITKDWIMLGGIPSPDTGFLPKFPATFCFGMAFVFGWLLHRKNTLMSVFQDRWNLYLILAVAFTAFSLWLAEFGTSVFGVDKKLIYAFSYATAMWSWVLGIIGISLRFFSKGNKAVRYVADASYWMYLAHLPLIFTLQMIMLKWPLHWSIKFPLIVILALLVLMLTYHYLVRNTYIGEILNGKKYSNKKVSIESDLVNASLSNLTSNFKSQQVNVDLPAAVELVGIRKSYGNNLALDGLDLRIERGELVALLGPNGAGKSTAISCMLGLQTPDEGKISIFGESPDSISARYEYGVMLQSVELPPELRVRELIDLSCSYYPAPMPLEELLRLTNISAIADRPYSKLSGGQKRLVQFAIAICGRPKLLFLDEPTVAMDIETRQLIWKTLRELVSQGCSIMLTTHYLEEAEMLADRVAVLAKGKLVVLGTVDEVRALVTKTTIRCITRLTAEYLMQWTGVISVNPDGDSLCLTVSDSDQILRRLSNEDSNLRILEVSRAGLSEAFSHITQEIAK